MMARSRPWILSTSSEEQKLLQRLEQEFPLMEMAGCKVSSNYAVIKLMIEQFQRSLILLSAA